MRISGSVLGLTMLALAAPALAGQDKPGQDTPRTGESKPLKALPTPVPAPLPLPVPAPSPAVPPVVSADGKPLQVAPGAGPRTEALDKVGRNGAIATSRDTDRPRQSFGPSVPGWYANAMAAIKAKRPAVAIELMTPLLAGFEKRYAEEKRKIFCAVSPEQSKAYLADAAKGAIEAVAIEPDWCRAQYVRGFALIDLGNLDDALKVFRTLTELAPRNSRYLNELGYVLADMKKYAESMAVYQRAIDAAELSPDGVNKEKCLAYRGLGYSMSKLGRLGDAQKAYHACLKIEPDNQEVIDAIEGLDKERQDTV